jgi:hypothetical protein
MNQIDLGPADNGRQIQMGLADTILVRLPECSASGAGWGVAVDGPARVTEDWAEAPSGPVAGAALVRYLGLAAQASGQVVLRAVRNSPFDDTVEEYSVELTVT